VTQHQLSFDRLSRVLEGIADDEVADAISSVRAFRAGRKPVGRQKRLAGLMEALEPDELLWLEMVLCVRVQQAGREAAWRRFAQSSYREVVAFYR
jgi:hypothetical protein